MQQAGQWALEHPDYVAAAGRYVWNAGRNLYQSRMLSNQRRMYGLAREAAMYGSPTAARQLRAMGYGSPGTPSPSRKRRLSAGSSAIGGRTPKRRKFTTNKKGKKKKRKYRKTPYKRPRRGSKYVTASQVKQIIRGMQRDEHATGHYKNWNCKALDAVGGGAGITTNSWSYIDNLTDNTATDAYGLQLFGPLQILDAASILFNAKAVGYDYTNTTGNLATDTKVDVVTSYCDFSLYNNTIRPAVVQFCILEPLNMEASQPGSIKTTLDTILTEGGINYDSVSSLYPFHEQQAVRNEYSVTVKQWVMQPGKRKNHRVNGKTGVYDMQVLLPNQVWPGLTKYIFIRAKGLPVSGLDSEMTPNVVAGYDNRNYASGGAPVTGQGIVVMKKQTLTIKCPENVDEDTDQWKAIDSGCLYDIPAPRSVEPKMPVDYTNDLRLVDRQANP